MKKAILLIRVSTIAQDLVQQTNKVMEHAIADGYARENIIVIEEKESGIKLKEEERLGLNRMKQHIETDTEIDCIYVYELSRLSRRANISYSIREYLINHNIQLICLNPYFKMLDDNGKLSESGNLMWGIFVSLSENEMSIKRERFRRGIEHKKMLGKHHTGRVLFGYATEKDGTFIPHPENAECVRLCYQLYLSGKYSTRTLGIELQQRGYYEKQSVFTLKNNVQGILRNIEYTGIGGKPQLVSKSDFEKVQEKLKSNRNSEYRVTRKALCKGLLYDKNKGYRLTYNAAGQSYFNTPRKCIWIGQSVIDPIVWDYAKKQHIKFHSDDKHKLFRQLGDEHKIWNKKEMVCVDKIRKLNERIDYIEERLIMGKISESKANDLEQKIKDEISMWESKREQAHTMKTEKMKQVVDMTSWNKNPLDYEAMDIDERCNVVNEVIQVIWCWKPVRTELVVEIHNKLFNRKHTIYINSYHKTVLDEKDEPLKI